MRDKKAKLIARGRRAAGEGEERGATERRLGRGSGRERSHNDRQQNLIDGTLATTAPCRESERDRSQGITGRNV